MKDATHHGNPLPAAAQALDCGCACRLGAVQLLCICPPPNVRAPSLRLLLPHADAVVQHACSVRFRVLRAVPRPGAQMLHAAQERPADESAASRRSARPTLMLNGNAASDGCREEAILQACSLGAGSSRWVSAAPLFGASESRGECQPSPHPRMHEARKPLFDSSMHQARRCSLCHCQLHGEPCVGPQQRTFLSIKTCLLASVRRQAGRLR